MRKKRKVKQSGYWIVWDNIESEFKQIIHNLNGRFPTHPDLLRLKLGGLRASLRRHGGLRGVRVRMGYKASQRPHGYWLNWENIRRELQTLVDLLGGRFPVKTDFIRMKFNSLYKAIKLYHGGVKRVRRRMGHGRSVRRPTGYWSRWENIVRGLKAIIRQVKHFPSQRELVMLGRSDINNGIELHGGLTTVRARMGYGPAVIRSSADLQALITNEKEAKNVVCHFGGNDVDVADILAVVYAERLDRERALEWLRDPSLRPWLVQFQNPKGSDILDLFEASEGLLPKDKDGIIAGIIDRRMLEWRRVFLGTRPSQVRKRAFQRELKKVERAVRGGSRRTVKK